MCYCSEASSKRLLREASLGSFRCACAQTKSYLRLGSSVSLLTVQSSETADRQDRLRGGSSAHDLADQETDHCQHSDRLRNRVATWLRQPTVFVAALQEKGRPESERVPEPSPWLID